MANNEVYCCDKFKKEAEKLQTPIGGGLLYPASERPVAQFEQNDDSWAINGCCGGGCHVVVGMQFCPFCGARL